MWGYVNDIAKDFRFKAIASVLKPLPTSVLTRRQWAFWLLTGVAFLYAAASFVFLAYTVPEMIRADYFHHLYLFSEMIENKKYESLLKFIFDIQSGHVLVPEKLIAILNYVLFDYSSLVSKITAISILIIYLGCFWYYASKGMGPSVGKALVLLLGTYVLLNPNGYRVYIWTDSVPAIYLSGLLSMFALFYQRTLFQDDTRSGITQWILWAALVATILLTNGSGVAILPSILLLLFLERKARWRSYFTIKRLWYLSLVVFGICVVAAVTTVYVYDWLEINLQRFHLSSTISNLSNILDRPWDFFTYTLAVVFSPIAQQSVSNMWLFGLGVLFCYFYVLLRVANGNGPKEAQPWAAFSLVGVVSALLIGLTRFEYNLSYMDRVASRFSVYVIPLYLGLVPVVFLLLRENWKKSVGRGEYKWRRFVFPGFIVVLGLSCLVATVVSFHQNLRRSTAITTELLIAQEATANWSMMHALRLTSAADWLGRYYLNGLPRLKQNGKASVITDRFIFDSNAFALKHNIPQPLTPSAVPTTRDSSICNRDGDGLLRFFGPDARFPFTDHPPYVPFARFVGHAYNVDVCNAKVDYVFATNGKGEILCVSRTMSHLWWDMPTKVLQKEYSGSQFAFDFSCPVPGGYSAEAPFEVYSYVIKPRTLLRLSIFK